MTSYHVAFDPLRATGAVVQGGGTFLGSCFLFRQSTAVLTAAHVVEGWEASQLQVLLPTLTPPESHVVKSITKCPNKGDMALLTLGTASSAMPFLDHYSAWSDGLEVAAFGYPEDIMGPNAGQPTPRVFRGHYQRYFYHRSKLGYEYNAGELSFGAPAGLSGGPVFHKTMPYLVTGLVTENFESTTMLEAVLEQLFPGHTKETRYERIIQYGIALLVDSYEPWLSERVPRRT